MTLAQGADHGAAMDRIYRWQSPIYDITRRYYLLGRDEMLAGIHPASGDAVLEIGCGTASNLIRLGRQWSDCALYGVDISRVMLAEAGQSLHKAGLAHRVTLAEADATQFDTVQLFGRPHFQHLVMSYTLSMIPQWEAALDQALTLLAPGGTLHIADFGPCDRWPSVLHRLLLAWLSAFSVTPRTTLKRLLQDKAARQGLSLTFSEPFGGYAVVARLSRPVSAQ